MYLLINMSKKNEIQLSLFNHEEKKDFLLEGANKDLLLAIDQFLGKEVMKKEDIKGIMVVVGAGGFTSTRLAVTVANTFGYVLQIPLMTITEEQIEDVQSFISELEGRPGGLPGEVPTGTERRHGQYISATYSGAPNINIK